MGGGSPACEWFENEAFWTAFRPLAFSPNRWEQAVCDVDALLKLLDCASRNPKVLDLCCGPGRHALELARRGAHVTAVDLSENYLAELTTRCEASKFHGRIEIIKSDMRAFKRSNEFDGAICIGLSFGYLVDRDQDLLVLKNINKSLRPGASLVLEVPTQMWPDQSGGWYIVDNEDGSALVEENVVPGQARVSSRWHFRRGPNTETYIFSQRLFTEKEVKDDLLRSGFTNVQIWVF